MKYVPLCLIFVSTLLMSGMVFGAYTTTWNGSEGNWDDDARWSSGEPGTGSTAVVDSGIVAVTLGGEMVHYNLYVGRYSGTNGRVNILSGSLNVGYPEYVGYGGSGSIHQYGGTHYPLMGLIIGQASASTGTYQLHDGLLDTATFRVGDSGTGTFTQTGGTTDCDAITIGYSATSHGTFEISAGTVTASALEIARMGAGTFDIQGSAADITLSSTFTLKPAAVLRSVSGGKIKLTTQYADVLNQKTAASEADVAGLRNMTLEFTGNSHATDWNQLEVAGADEGLNVSGYCGNFYLNTLAVGGAATSKVKLVDTTDNGNRGGGSECLYVRKLIVTTGSTLDLNYLKLYYQEAQIDGTVLHGTPQPIESLDMNGDDTVDVYELSVIAENWLDNTCSCPDRCGGADLDFNGRVDLFDMAILADHWLE